MPQAYVRLADHAIFKFRYDQWYLINTHNRERERILIEGGAEQILNYLFAGNSVDAAGIHFSVERTDLYIFLQGLVDENVVAWSDDSVDSTAGCHNIEPPLDSMNILLTNTCNLHCAHCYVSSGKPMDNELSGDEWISVLQEARQLGVFELNVSGGEATLHRDFVRIAEHIASVPTFNANLNTNGFLLQPEQEDVIVRAFKSVQISIDDVVAAKHDAFRGHTGSFDRSLATISRLVKSGVETNIGFTLTFNNLDALDGVVELAESLNVTMLNIGLVANFGRASNDVLANGNNQDFVQDSMFMERVYQKIKKLATRPSKIRFLLPFRIPSAGTAPELNEKRFLCAGDNTQIIYIMANGNIMPCDKLPIERFSFGNVRQSSILDVWQSQSMKSFKLMSPRQLPKCKVCPHLQICGGACVARAYQNGGSFESPDWTSCVIAQKIHRDNTA